MSVGPLTSVLVSAAGSPLAQQSSEIDRNQTETAATQRKQFSAIKADRAAGIGETDGENHEINDRDADGRRLWEIDASPQQPTPTDQEVPLQVKHSLDPSGESGNRVDLTA